MQKIANIALKLHFYCVIVDLTRKLFTETKRGIEEMQLNLEHRVFIRQALEEKHLGKLEIVPGENPGSKKMEYTLGNMRYENCFYGEKDFFGTEVVWEDGKAIWGRNYIGQVLKDDLDEKFLHQMCIWALNESESPKFIYKSTDDFKEYKRNIEGTWTFFRGHDLVFDRGLQVYDCYYQGGTIGLV